LDDFHAALGLSAFAPGAALEQENPAEAAGQADEPVDIFAAALRPATAPAPPSSAPPTAIVLTIPETAIPSAPPMAIEPPLAVVAFEAPVRPPDAPDPHVAAALLRLERFLGAIQTARQA
jgi:hypothetical protein